jgi:hypothetical protein
MMSIDDFEQLPIREQLAIIYETLCCEIIPILGESDPGEL